MNKFMKLLNHAYNYVFPSEPDYESSTYYEAKLKETVKTLELSMRDTFPKVVCLCGSTKFKQEFIKENFEQTMHGNIVLTVGFFAHSDTTYELTPEEKVKLDELHKRKIDMADEIIVINVNDYIGESTRSEIEYATRLGLPVYYVYPHNN